MFINIDFICGNNNCSAADLICAAAVIDEIKELDETNPIESKSKIIFTLPSGAMVAGGNRLSPTVAVAETGTAEQGTAFNS